ncbi:hypothetical protein B566_EDAN011556 [Ephemera danica]|nr:hypothetical protein B566_EDAN011556 [Ephemera danica]
MLLRPGPHRECRDGAGRLVDSRYDYDAMSALCLLKHHGLERSFKLSVTPGREHLFAAAFSAMGSVNVTSNWKHSETILINEPYGPEITLLFKSIVEQGGLQTGGCSMELSLRRESTDLKDVFVLHAQLLDVLARSLKSAVRLLTDGFFTKHVQVQTVRVQNQC